MPKKRSRKHGKGQQSSAGNGMSASREISDRQQKEEAATPRAPDSAQAEGVPQHTSSSECDELSLWKLSERMNRSQAQKLGVKLGISSTKLENLHDKVQRKICSQEEMNFEMLHKWNANQIPDDDPEAKLCQMLRDLEIPEKIVQEMFTKENHLHQATQERVLKPLQLYQIAEKVDRSQHIPIVLRLGLNFNDLELTKQRCCNHADYYCLFKLLLEWQRDLPPRIDQIETMSSVLSASEQKRLAYNIRNNCWNVISGDKGRSIMLGTETRHTFCDMDLIITCRDPAKQEQILSRVKSVFEKCSSKVELSSHGETCTLDKSTERVKKVHDECQDVSRFLSDLQEAGTRANMYETNGVTISSIILHVRVYSEEGLRSLKEDINSGAIGRRLANVLMLHETGAPSSDDEILDVALAAGTIDHIAQQSAGMPFQRMENWGEEEVKVWLRSVVLFPEKIVSKFDDIDGFTLLRYTTDQLQADFGLSIVNCRKLEHRLQEHLEKEGMEGCKILSNVTSLGGKTEGAHALESQTLSKQERSTVTHDDAMHVGPSSGKKIRDTAESSLESPEKVQSGVSPVSSYVPKGDVKPKVKEPKFSKESEKKLAQLLIGSDKGQLDASYYPVLVANAPSEQINTERELNEKFGFMSSVNWNVVFDCNPESNDTGLCSIVTKRRRIKILSPKDFQTKDYDKQKEDIEFPEVPVWLYPNGRLDVKEDKEEKLSNEAWIRDRSYAVSNAVRFFSDPEVIPPGRAVVIFLLLSDSDIMVMTQIFREFYTSTSFQNLQCFTVLAEDERVLQKWIQSLEMQQIVKSNEMKLRCLSGVPWQEINLYMLRLLGSCETTLPQLPMSPKGACVMMKKHQSQWTDISVLARNECENTSMDDKNPNFPDFVREKEEKFYQGHEVDWWNFHLSEGKGHGYNHVLRRESFSALSSIVNHMLKFQKKNISHISLVTIFHEPGSGGTTVAKNVLWELHKEYRCAVVNRVTNDTVNQIMALRRYNYEKSDKPAPVVILLENLDSESMRSFLINLEREAKNVTDEGLAVFLLNCKRTNEPENFLKNDKNQPCVAVQHKLSQRERDWFRKKIDDLERSGFSVKDTPEQLLAFMVMKEECRPEYLQDVVRRILPALGNCKDKDKKALVILKYIAAMHKYCTEFAMPVSACDQYMQKNISFTVSMTAHKKKRPWEKERPKFLKLLLIEVIIPDIDGFVKGLGIAHYTLAAEILSQLHKDFNQTPADIFLEFLMKSPILDTKSHSKEYIKKTCRNMMVRRMKKEHGDEIENFSPLIEDVYKEDKSKAYTILEVGIRKFEDPIIAQQKARLHSIYDHDYDQAEHSIDIALDLVRGKNSYLWDTKGIILREKMADFDQTKTQEPLSDEDTNSMLKIFEDACSAFQNSQSANEGEADHNNGGFLGEIITIFKFLGVIQKRVEPFNCDKEGLDKMRMYLTTDFIPDELISHALQDHHSVLKSLVERVETVLGCVTDFMAQCAWQRFHTTQNRIIERKLEKIYNSRHQYFGLKSKPLPSYQQEPKTANAMRRAEVTRRISDGYRCIFEMASTRKVDDLKGIQTLLKINVESQPYLFDVKSLVLVSFALGVCSEKHFDEDETRHWVHILKELEEETYGFYGLFFEMILNWPERTLKRSDIPPIKDTIKELECRWRKKYNPVHNLDVPSISHKRSRVRQNVYPLKAATDFYLGKQDRFRLIHKSKIGKITHAVWKEQEVKRLLSSLEGVLDNKQHLIYNPQGQPMKIRLSLPIQGLPSREPVTFFLGFSFSGPVAYGVRYRDERDIPFCSREARVSLPEYIERESSNADDS